ncbi:MAG: GMC oxidoreductase, partial [Actinomycetia bacterium]|nr:GMC oxidoreductase [Actinomycetes bacterium]
ALLLRSGIGPADELREVGVEPLVDLPGVGRNLQDHLDVCLTASSSVPSYNELGHSWRLVSAVAEYALHRSGPITSNVCEAGLFWDSDSSLRPDIQMSGLPTYGNGRRQGGHGFTVNVSNLRPRSRGVVRLRSADPGDAPLIDPRFLTEPEDWRITLRGIEQARALLRTPAMRALDVVEQEPGPDLGSEQELRAYTNARSRTGYHPVGTCAMGTGPEAVVDPALKVYGVEQLRIVDSSVMPRLISGNTMAPAYLVGEKGADLLLGATADSAAVRLPAGN